MNQIFFVSKNCKKSAQRGSVLTIILVAVSLFAALGYTVANMMRTGNPHAIGEEKAKLYAGEIMDYGRSLRNAIQSMRISNSCMDDGISFSVNPGDAYEHTPAVADTCKVFHIEGGARNYVDPSASWLDTTMSGNTEYGAWYFDGNHCINDVGTTASPCVDANNELLLVLPHISRDICIAINNALNVTNPADVPPEDNHDNAATKFTGAYTAGTNSLLSTAEIDGRLSACIRDDTGDWQDSYIYYQVLRAR